MPLEEKIAKNIWGDRDCVFNSELGVQLQQKACWASFEGLEPVL